MEITRYDFFWQEIINKHGVEGALEILLQEFHERESLQQPSPNKIIPSGILDGD